MTPTQLAQLHHAGRLLAQGANQAAVQELQTLYEQTDDFAVNRELTRALLAVEQYGTALTIANEQRAAYLTSADLQEQLLTIELANHGFIRARQLAWQLPTPRQGAAQAQIAATEATLKTRAPQTLHTRLQHFYHLGDGGLLTQQRRFAEALRLPLAEFIQGSRFVLRDPFVKPLVKSTVVQSLVQLKVDQELTMLWLDDHEYPFTPAACLPLEAMPVVQVGYAELAKRFANSDPLTYQARLQTFNLHLALLYPFVDKAMIDPDRWIDEMSQPHQGPAATSTEKMIRCWQRRLNAQLAQLGL
ncbi:hypothetical protein [Limosilactobacillus ingluviei]|uniref:hypothetical protein n=1 Tax=Limosilactobacillus ingluviei TaxID=148604 RepID=UPI0023F34F6D|nr:hypothetical protein [Limosilactobacillus ingluviei]